MAAIQGETLDRVANMPLIKQFCTRQLGWKYVDYNRDHRVLVEAQLRMHDRWGFDCFNTIGYPYREAGDCGLPLLWLEDTVPKAQGVLVRDRSDIAAIRWPDPWEGPLMSDRLQAIRLFKEHRPDVAVLGWVEGCFAQAATFRGMDQALMDLVLGPDLLRELMDVILPHELAFAKAQVEAGADIIGVGDSAASLVGPAHYAELILPYEMALISGIRQTGAPVKLHICGDITELLPAMAGLPVDIVDIDWQVDLREARRVLGPAVCLCGNFDPVAVLLHGTPDGVRSECRRCVREAGAPFILAPGCEVPPDTPAQNFSALCEPYEPAVPTAASGDDAAWEL
jgi:MtaA/CmuA family methyltransferase